MANRKHIEGIENQLLLGGGPIVCCCFNRSHIAGDLGSMSTVFDAPKTSSSLNDWSRSETIFSGHEEALFCHTPCEGRCALSTDVPQQPRMDPVMAGAL
jgi:hypothetical protein